MAEAARKMDEPQGEWLSESEIAKRVRLDRATVVRRLEDLGYEPDEERSGPKLKVHFFTDEMAFELKAAKDTVAAVKIQDLRWAAKLKRQKYEREAGELVPIGEVTDLAQRLVKKLYEEHAVRMPKRVAGHLVKAKTVAAVRKILKTDADKVFKMVRADFERYVNG